MMIQTDFKMDKWSNKKTFEVFFSSNFSHSKSSWGLKMIYCPNLSFRYPDMDIISFFSPKMTLNEKGLICRSRRKLQVSYKVYLHPSS
jgi:hypothetical protein